MELLTARQQVDRVTVTEMGVHGRQIDTDLIALVVNQHLCFNGFYQGERTSREQQSYESGQLNSTHFLIVILSFFLRAEVLIHNSLLKKILAFIETAKDHKSYIAGLY
jgi:hypothetical protein